MRFSIASASAILAFVSSVAAHMEMMYPPPLKSRYNSFAGYDIDYSMTAPLSGEAQYPCKGYLNLLDTDAGKSVATWSAGGSYNMTITGGANHGGGSCQASLSYDKGKTFTVIHSYEGNCPTAGTSSYDFQIPSDAQSGEAIFAWTWFNKIGNREMYMNCASVTIGSSSKKIRDTTSTTFSSRPQAFVANLDGSSGCQTIEGADISFPNPGPDVTGSGSSNGLQNCASSGSSSSSGSGYSASVGASSAAGAGASSAAASTPVAVGTGDVKNPSVTPISASASIIAPTGGAFLPTAESSIASAPTTLATTTRAASTGASSTITTPASTGTSDFAGMKTVGSVCSDEGAWNCIDGTSFQRCASSQWSAAITMSSGTACKSGVAAQLIQISSRHLRNRI